MKMIFKYTDKIVGAFIILSWFIFFGAIILILINQKVFIKKYHYNTIFEDSKGLRKQSEILFQGFVIGKITDYRLNDEDTVDVDFYIYENYIDRFTLSSVMSKSTSPIAGSIIEFLKNDTTDDIYPEFSFVPSLDTPQGKLIMASGLIKKKSDSISHIITQVDMLLTSLNTDHNESDSAIARTLVNTADTMEILKREMYTFGEILDNFKNLSYQMREADGLVQRLVDPTGEYMFNSLQESLGDLNLITENLTLMSNDLKSFTTFINGQQREIDSVIQESREAMRQATELIEGIKNNPLIKGGVPVRNEQEVIKQNIREWIIE